MNDPIKYRDDDGNIRMPLNARLKDAQLFDVIQTIAKFFLMGLLFLPINKCEILHLYVSVT